VPGGMLPDAGAKDTEALVSFALEC
jgi:hypothetical protein